MEYIVITSLAELKDFPSLQQQLPQLIKESWRKIKINMDSYTEEYEQNEQEWGLPMIEEQFKQGSRFVIGQENLTCVSAVVVDEHTHQGEPALQLRFLVVHPDHQGRGLAQQLIGHVVQLARLEEKRYLTLYTSGLLNSLIRFYLRIGFTEFQQEQVTRYGLTYNRVFFEYKIARIPCS